MFMPWCDAVVTHMEGTAGVDVEEHQFPGCLLTIAAMLLNLTEQRLSGCILRYGGYASECVCVCVCDLPVYIYCINMCCIIFASTMGTHAKSL